MEVANKVDGAIRAVMAKEAMDRVDTVRVDTDKEATARAAMARVDTEDSKEVGVVNKEATEGSKADGEIKGDMAREDTAKAGMAGKWERAPTEVSKVGVEVSKATARGVQLTTEAGEEAVIIKEAGDCQ